MTDRRRVLAEAAKLYGTPCFVYFRSQILDRLKQIEAAFGDRLNVSYAMKANPHSAMLSLFREHLDWLDISSIGEFERARACGWDPARMSFTGPAKLPFEIERAVACGVGHLVVESIEEADVANCVAGQCSHTQPVLLRIAPKSLPRGFGVSMSGKPTQFGIDEEQAEAAVAYVAKLGNIRLDGFHIYAGTQCLNASAVAENIRNCADIFESLSASAGIQPSVLVFGSGFGIRYHEGMEALDLQQVAGEVNPRLDALRSDERFAKTRLLLEIGRFLVGEAGVFVTSIVGVKHSRGSIIGLCDGGMNNHLGACGHLGSVIHRNYRMSNISLEPDEPSVPVTLVGPLCTSIDTLAHDVEMPTPRVGDLIAIECSGAYGQTSSPASFISHPTATEVWADGERLLVLPDESRLHERLSPTPRLTPAGQEGLVVLGTPRSGTTLLRRLIDSHPRIACPGETNLLSACGRFLHKETIASGLDIGVSSGLGFAGFTSNDLLVRLREIVVDFHVDYARRHGKPRWAEKTAFDAFYLEQIEELLTGHARFVCIVRHGLDFVASMIELCNTNGTYLAEIHDYVRTHASPAEAFAHCWVDLTTKLMDFAARHPKDSIFMRYEDLVADPETMLRRTFALIGEDLPPNLVSEALEARSNVGLGDWKTYGRTRIDAASVGRGGTLSPYQRGRLAPIMNATLERAGYQPVATDFGQSQEAARRAMRSAWCSEALGMRARVSDTSSPTRLPGAKWLQRRGGEAAEARQHIRAQATPRKNTATRKLLKLLRLWWRIQVLAIL